jgi:hypothetical protein
MYFPAPAVVTVVATVTIPVAVTIAQSSCCFLYRNRRCLGTLHQDGKGANRDRCFVCYERVTRVVPGSTFGDAHVTRRNESANERPIERVLTCSGALETPVRPFGPVFIPRACALTRLHQRVKKITVYGRLRMHALTDSMYRSALTPRCPTATTHSPHSPRTSIHAVSPESPAHHPSCR